MSKKNSNKKKPIRKILSKKRDKRIVFQLNEPEFDALSVYCKRYHVSNRSEFIRRTLLSKISKTFVEDYPTLF